VPYRRQRWRFVWPGAILATILWLLAIAGFGWYAEYRQLQRDVRVDRAASRCWYGWA
jgi:hypothetical protein